MQPDCQSPSLPHPRGEEERHWILPILNPASFLESIIALPHRGRRQTQESFSSMQHHFHGVIVLHPRFQGDSSNNHDPKYSLILRVFHCPTPEGKRRDPRLSIPHTASFSGSFIAPLQRGRGEIPDSLFFIQPHSQGLSLPHCRGEGERSQTPYSSYSLILRVFHCPTPEGIGERPQTPYPTYSLIQSETKIEPDLRLHSRGLSLPQPRGKRERPQTPYSSYSL